ncbi:tRNA lysidine(34) synthetase TilS [Sphingomonas sp. NSE70-1]|uniref:tRNA(Ile)-lysidine synthase n=1 Tax=Sphingomonas caseinilyticus TaxID=2908205 RepID=A0ABT0RW30_9SPHN|nr:tRNA lysidine(34) synthetase TilS [Sphingomonas caseinilyticus]MCL6699237.1 tRNA lysidine(34) synthetase TilS [Sphingomonas caseinilyticus]
MATGPPPDLVDRFAADLGALIAKDVRLGVAVSGGPDSLALLLLAFAARPNRVEVATVDHGLRSESAVEAEMVADACAQLGVPHRTLVADWPEAPTTNLQAEARAMRYRLLNEWAIEQGLAAIATAHHADDQAETLLMRLMRGAGVGGLGATRARRPLSEQVMLVRPLLGWRKAELVGLVTGAGLDPVDDPSNRDPRHDRSRIRSLLDNADWADPARMAASASALRDADEALDWALAPLIGSRIRQDGGGLVIEPFDLPRELKRRLLLAAFAELAAPPPRGPDAMRALDALERGETVTLSGLKLEGGSRWRLSLEQPRRS